MKRILHIDAREAFADRRTGKGQWTRKIIDELMMRNEYSLVLLVHKPLQGDYAKFAKVLPAGWRYFFALRRILKRSNAKILLSPTSFLSALFAPKAVQLVSVVHDTIAWQKDPHQLKARIMEKTLFPILLTKKPILVTVSGATKQDLLQLFPSAQQLSVTSIGAGPHEQNPTLAVKDDTYFLLPSTLCPRKNQLGAIKAHTLLPLAVQQAHPLLLVGGRGWNDEAIIQAVEASPYVTWKGYVPDEEYRQLLHHCYALLFPSFYEGFGLPVLDALQRGVPVISSNHGSLAEIVHDAAYIVDPYSIQSISAGMLALSEQAELYETLSKQGPKRAAHFSWKRTVDRLIEQFPPLSYV